LAPNQAEAKWSWALLDAFTQHGVQVEGISHCPEQVWPRGKKLWVSAKGWAIEKYSVHGIGYLNLPWIRERFLAYHYRRKMKQVFRSRSPFDAIIGYNILYPQDIAVIEVAKRLGIPYFGIILDGEDPRRDNWRWVLRNTKYADGLAFLSHWMVQNYPGPLPTLHFDGGGGEWKGDRAIHTREKNLVVYTGGLDYWRGVDFLAEVVRQLKRQDVRIVLCGKCNRTKIWSLFGNDPRVEVKGFVSETEMNDWCCRASVFLNVRDPQFEDNIVNFPSKIPNYLAYGKPIVSTWLPSLHPMYRDVLEVVDEKNPAIFATRIEHTLSLPDEYYQEKSKQIGAWYCTEKTWSGQTGKLLGWMNATLSKIKKGECA
jgi:glycosyltransferase involved in cell wall biosynthesis